MKRKALKAAFPYTIPIFAGFWFLIQARHLFYGISMLDKFKGMGWKKFYLIFGMCDETRYQLCNDINVYGDFPRPVVKRR